MAGNSNNLIIVAAIIVVFFLTISTCSLAACNSQDRKALLAFQASFPGNLLWPSTGDCCSWSYVRCTNGRITYLNIDGDEDVPLNGSIPAAIGDLTALEDLSLRFMPGLDPSLPYSPCCLPSNMSISETTCSRVQFPPLSKTSRTSIPSPYSRTSSKERSHRPYSAGRKKLSGDASFLLGKNKKMNTLILDDNKFAFDLTNVEYPLTLTYLTISHNKIYGSINNQITELPNLSSLDMSDNLLCGKIPSGGHFKNFSADSFANNKCLCGTPLPPCK